MSHRKKALVRGQIKKVLTVLLLAWAFEPASGQLRIWGDPALFEHGMDLLADPGGGFWMLGTAEPGPGAPVDFSLARLDAAGQRLWSRFIGTPQFDFAARFYRIPDGFLLSGSSAPQAGFPSFGLVIQTDTLGNALQTFLLGDSIRNFFLRQALPMPDGGWVAVGAVSGVNGIGNDPWIARFDAQGAEIWNCPYRDSLSDYAQVVLRLPDGGFAVACDRQTASGMYNAYVLRLDSVGQVVWQAAPNTSRNGGSQDLLLLPDGDFILIGESFPDPSVYYFDFYFARISAEGRWVKEFFVGGPEGDAAFRGVLTPEGEVWAAGYGWEKEERGADVMVVRTDTAFSFVQTLFFGRPGLEHGSAIAQTDTGFVVVGLASEGLDSQYLWVAGAFPKIASYTGRPKDRQPPYPNPVRAGQLLHLPLPFAQELWLTDVCGRLARCERVNENSFRIPSDLPPGWYALRLELPGGGSFKIWVQNP